LGLGETEVAADGHEAAGESAGRRIALEHELAVVAPDPEGTGVDPDRAPFGLEDAETMIIEVEEDLGHLADALDGWCRELQRYDLQCLIVLLYDVL
jgi:hypothetical protein